MADGESGFSSKMFNPSSQHLTSSCVKDNNTLYDACVIVHVYIHV